MKTSVLKDDVKARGRVENSGVKLYYALMEEEIPDCYLAGPALYLGSDGRHLRVFESEGEALSAWEAWMRQQGLPVVEVTESEGFEEPWRNVYRDVNNNLYNVWTEAA